MLVQPKIKSYKADQPTEKATQFLKGRPGGFGISGFIRDKLQEEARLQGWNPEFHEGYVIGQIEPEIDYSGPDVDDDEI